MLCERCQQNEATIHASQSINGAREEHHLCAQCAQELRQASGSTATSTGFPSLFAASGGFFGGEPLAGMNINHIFKDFFGTAAPNSQAVGGQTTPAPCPGCGTNWNDFQSQGLLGCDQCYEHYAARLPQLLRRLHGRTGHVGKVPLAGEAHLVQANQLNDLRNQLQQAVNAEDFERACSLRDEIRTLEETDKAGDGDA